LEHPVSAEIFEFPDRERHSRLAMAVENLDKLARDIERFLTTDRPADLHYVLEVIEALSDRLLEIGSLLLDSEKERGLRAVFDALSATIVQTRRALFEIDGRMPP
jgi:hypothetical protein